MDWSDDDLRSLGNLDIHYSGVSSEYEEVHPRIGEYTSTIQSRSFCTDSLFSYSVPNNCSTSWATAIVRAAEAAMNDSVKLSVNQVLRCLPEYAEVDGCRGVHPRMIREYLKEVGLVKESEFDTCDNVNEHSPIQFTTVTPQPPTAGGLMNLISSGKPVFAMVAVDLLKLRYVKDMSKAEEGIKCGGYGPSLYGMVTGYRLDKTMDSSWWEMRSHVVPCEEMVLKMPVSPNMNGANYAGIAAYAFGIERIESDEIPSDKVPDVPTDKPIPSQDPTDAPTVDTTTDAPTVDTTTDAPTTDVTESPTQEAPTPTNTPFVTPSSLPDDGLIISEEDECELIFEKHWSYIIVEDGVCNDYSGNLTLSDYPNLLFIEINGESFSSIHSFELINNPLLGSLKIQTSGEEYSYNCGLSYTEELVFKGQKGY